MSLHLLCTTCPVSAVLLAQHDEDCCLSMCDCGVDVVSRRCILTDCNFIGFCIQTLQVVSDRQQDPSGTLVDLKPAAGKQPSAQKRKADLLEAGDADVRADVTEGHGRHKQVSYMFYAMRISRGSAQLQHQCTNVCQHDVMLTIVAQHLCNQLTSALYLSCVLVMLLSAAVASSCCLASDSAPLLFSTPAPKPC